MRFIPLCVAALSLAGCASTSIGGTGGDALARPKTIVVSDLVWGTEVVAVDRGFTARLERKIGAFPTHERKPRTIERVNDEIVAGIVADLREAGLEAQPGSEDALSLRDDAIVLTGRLRAGEPATARSDKKKKDQNDQIGFGAGRDNVVADIAVAHFSSSGRKQLLSFSAQAKDAGKPLTGKQAAAGNAAIAAALAAEKAAPEKLSADVEAQARRLARAVSDKFLAYAKAQGWLEKTDAAETVAEEKPARMPPARPAAKPDKPAA